MPYLQEYETHELKRKTETKERLDDLVLTIEFSGKNYYSIGYKLYYVSQENVCYIYMQAYVVNVCPQIAQVYKFSSMFCILDETYFSLLEFQRRKRI